MIVMRLMLDPSADALMCGLACSSEMSPCSAPADWCSYSPSLKCIPITAKSSPPRERTSSNGDACAFARFGAPPPTFASICPGPSKRRKMASGLRKMSRGPMNPARLRRTETTAASVEMAAEEPWGRGAREAREDLIPTKLLRICSSPLEFGGLTLTQRARAPCCRRAACRRGSL